MERSTETIERLQANNEHLRGQLSEYQERLGTLMVDLGTITAKLKTESAAKSAAEKGLDIAKKEVCDIQRSTEISYKSFKKRADSADKREQEALAKVNKRNGDLNRTMEKAEVFLKQNGSLSDENKKLRKENASLKKKSASLELKVNKLTNKIDDQAVSKQNHAREMLEMKMRDNATHLSIQMAKTKTEQIKNLAKIEQQKAKTSGTKQLITHRGKQKQIYRSRRQNARPKNRNTVLPSCKTVSII